MLPFEGAGAISTWRHELPTQVRQFDYDTISDVILHMQYTSLDGGVLLRQVANDSIKNFQEGVPKTSKSGLWTVFDLKNDFPCEWGNFVAQQVAGRTSADFQLKQLTDHLPYWARMRRNTVKAKPVVLMLTPETISKTDTEIDWKSCFTLTGVTGWSEEKVGDTAVKLTASMTESLLKDWSLNYKVVEELNSKVKLSKLFLMIQYTIT